jgi:hypothetical protein
LSRTTNKKNQNYTENGLRSRPEYKEKGELERPALKTLCLTVRLLVPILRAGYII